MGRFSLGFAFFALAGAFFPCFGRDFFFFFDRIAHISQCLLFGDFANHTVYILFPCVMTDNGIVNTLDHDYLTSGRHSAKPFLHIAHRFFPLTDKPHSLS